MKRKKDSISHGFSDKFLLPLVVTVLGGMIVYAVQCSGIIDRIFVDRDGQITEVDIGSSGTYVLEFED